MQRILESKVTLKLTAINLPQQEPRMIVVIVTNCSAAVDKIIRFGREGGGGPAYFAI